MNDSENNLVGVSTEYLYEAASNISLPEAVRNKYLLQCYDSRQTLSKAHKATIENAICLYCGTPWLAGNYSTCSRRTVKLSNAKVKKLLRKQETAPQKLTKIQKRLLEKHDVRVIIKKCQTCEKETKTILQKSKEVLRKPKVEEYVTTKKTKRKTKKDPKAGLLITLNEPPTITKQIQTVQPSTIKQKTKQISKTVGNANKQVAVPKTSIMTMKKTQLNREDNKTKRQHCSKLKKMLKESKEEKKGASLADFLSSVS